MHISCTQGFLEKINVYGNPDAISIQCMAPPKPTAAVPTVSYTINLKRVHQLLTSLNVQICRFIHI